MKRIALINARKSSGWSRKDVATILDVAEITVRSIENGNRDPGAKLAAKFAYLFDVKIELLFPDIFLPDKDTKRIIKTNTKRAKEQEASQ